MAFVNPESYLGPRHIGESNVHHHEIGDRTTGEHFQGMCTRIRIHTREPTVVQMLADHSPDRRLVLDHENEWGHVAKVGFT
jgi:hypothetical protein